MVRVAFRDEVDAVAVPHREDVLRAVLGEPRGLFAGEIVKPQVVRLAAAVALPGAELAEHAVVDHLLAVRREGAPSAPRQRQHLRHAARELRQGELALEGVPLGAPRPVHHRPAVAPRHHDVVRPHAVRHVVAFQRGGVGEAPRHAALGRHHVHLGVAVVLAGEGEGLPVGREAREHLVALGIAGDPPCHAAPGGHREQVAGVAEDDLVAVDGREPEQPRFGRPCADRAAERQETTEPRARRESRQDEP